MRKHIEIPIYNCRLTVIKCQNVGIQYNRLLRKYPKIGKPLSQRQIAEAGAYFCSETDQTEEYFIILPEDADMSIIAHECFHAVCCILRDHDIRIMNSTEEAGAYLMGFLFSEVCTLFADEAKKIRL